MRRYLMGLTLALFSLNAQAITGSKLHEYGKDYMNGASFNSGVFMGYVVGHAESLVSDNLLCLPDELTYKQIGHIVFDYLDDNPEDWHYPGGLIVLYALNDAYPCS